MEKVFLLFVLSVFIVSCAGVQYPESLKSKVITANLEIEKGSIPNC